MGFPILVRWHLYIEWGPWYFKQTVLTQLIEGEWCIYASVDETIIGSDKGLSPGRHQAIIWTNAGIFLIWTLRTNFSQIRYFHYRKCIWKSCWKMAAILSQPQCVNKNSRLQVHMPNTATTVTCPLISWGLWFVASDTIWDTFYWHGLTLIQAWISNYMPGKVWDEITYPFLNFNGATVEV